LEEKYIGESGRRDIGIQDSRRIFSGYKERIQKRRLLQLKDLRVDQ